MPESVATGFARVTVVGARTRADVALPDAVPVAELLPDVVALLGEPCPGDVGGYRLTRLDEPPLPADGTLAEAAVLDGELLYLVAVQIPPPPPVVEDLVDVVAGTVAAAVPPWTPRSSQRLLLAAGAGLAAGAAALLVVDGLPARGSGLVAALVAVLLLALAAAGRLRGAGGWTTVPPALAALPYAGVAGLAFVMPATGGGAGRAVAGAALGVALAGLLAALAAPAAAPPGLAAAAAALPVAAGAGAALRWAATPADVAAVVALVELALIAVLPGLVARATGVAAAGGGYDAATSAPAAERLRRRVRFGHRVLRALVAASAAVLGGAVVVLALDGAAARWLAAAVAGTAVLRARLLRSAGAVLPLPLVGLAGLVGLEVAWARQVGPAGRHAAVLVAGLGTAAGLAAAGLAVGRLANRVREVGAGSVSGLAVERALDRLETVVMLSLVPLALGVLGVYGSVGEAARRLH